MGIVKNATFIVDLDDIKLSDLKADDFGSWKTSSTKTTYSVCYQMDLYIVSFKPNSKQKSRYYSLTRRYFMPST